MVTEPKGVVFQAGYADAVKFLYCEEVVSNAYVTVYDNGLVLIKTPSEETLVSITTVEINWNLYKVEDSSPDDNKVRALRPLSGDKKDA